MKYLIILALFCSCSTTFKVNGVDVKQRTRAVDKSHESHVIGYLFICTGITALYLPK